MELKEWTKVQESLVKSQIRTISQFLKEAMEPEFKRRGRGRSQMSIVYDILLSAPKPLHVTKMISQAKNDFNVDLDRESIVSPMTKKVKSGRMFKRVKANTFTILSAKEKGCP